MCVASTVVPGALDQYIVVRQLGRTGTESFTHFLRPNSELAHVNAGPPLSRWRARLAASWKSDFWAAQPARSRLARLPGLSPGHPGSRRGCRYFPASNLHSRVTRLRRKRFKTRIAQHYRGRVAVAWQRNRHGHVVAVLLPGNMPRAISGYVWVIFPAWQLHGTHLAA